MNELFSVCWNITNKCNENCQFCYRKITNDNTLEENIKIFDNINNVKINKITIAGGEPLLYKDIFPLVDYIKNKNPNIILSITTNGKIIDENLIEDILTRFDWITFSIDSSIDNTNKTIGRGIEHLNKVLSLLDKFNNKINIKINTVVNKYNINNLNEIYNIILKYNIARWKLFRFYPARKDNATKKLFKITDEESKQIESWIKNLNKTNKNIKIQYNDYDEIATSYFSIYSDGSIENKLNQVVGNLLTTKIEDILKIKKDELQNHNLRKNYEIKKDY